jgi:hypothetical protein
MPNMQIAIWFWGKTRGNPGKPSRFKIGIDRLFDEIP